MRNIYQRHVVQAIMNYKITPEKEDYSIPALNSHPDGRGAVQISEGDSSDFISNLRMFPPPVFSRQSIPHLYK